MSFQENNGHMFVPAGCEKIFACNKGVESVNVLSQSIIWN